MPVRSLLVVDGDPFVRQAVCEHFTREGDFDVCGEAENGREAIEKARLLRPKLNCDGPFDAGHERIGRNPCAEEAHANGTCDYFSLLTAILLLRKKLARLGLRPCLQI